ncbi:MAG: isoprenylcysteine carboxylmethyltransferase family protein [Candidatus Thorarchaeota archaeon]
MEINVIFRITYLLLWLLYLLSRVIPSRGLPSLEQSQGERRAGLREEGWYIIFTLIMVVYGNIIVAALYLFNPQWMLWSYLSMPLELRALGLALAIFLVPYTYWIGSTLAENYSYTVEIQEGQTLITTGPYNRVRHPIYSSAIFFLASLVLVSDNWLFLVVLLLTIPGLYIRIKREEEMMIREYGEEYRAYLKRTGRIFPKIRQSD